MGGVGSGPRAHPATHAYATLGFDTSKRHRSIDAYGDGGYWSFLQAIEDGVRFPFHASLVGAAGVAVRSYMSAACT